MSEILKRDENAARNRLLTFCPRDDWRSIVFRAVGDSIVLAGSLDNDRWGLTLGSGLLRLNVGMIEVISLFPSSVRFIVDAERVLQDLPRRAIASHVRRGSGNESVFASVEGAASFFCEWGEAGPLIERILPAHQVLVSRAAESRRNSMTKAGHSPAGVRALASLVRMDLHQPDYCPESPKRGRGVRAAQRGGSRR